MSDQRDSRRKFLKWIGLAPGALLLLETGCADSAPNGAARDAGRRDAADGDSGSIDAGGVDSGQPDSGQLDSGQLDAGGADASADVDAGTCEPTGSDVEGPFHLDNAPERTVLAEADEPGERIVIEGTVYGPDCRTPVADANLDVWHADDEGNYHDDRTEYRLRGQIQTDAQGRYRFETIMPGRYPLGGSTRPAHIHFIVTKPGFVPLTTQLYFAGDPFLSPNDPCGDGCNSGDPTLIIDMEPNQESSAQQGTFDIILRRP